MKQILIFWTLLAASTSALSSPIYYMERLEFLLNTGASITDDYTGYTDTPGGPLNLTNEEMSAVFGESAYESLSFTNMNLVGNVYLYGDGTNYCAGCNGNFRITFDDTSLSSDEGVFGVGLDIVFHTSRRSSLGNVLLGQTSEPGTVVIEFTDGDMETYSIPADIGFFEPEVFFFGVTDERGIKALTVGTELLSQRHSWVIDNLTIAEANIPEPSSLALLGISVFGMVGLNRTLRTKS